jgi:hypothetical protein
MSDKTGGNRVLRRAGALAVAAAVAVLTAACGVHVSFGVGSASTGSATYRANLAYAQCMRTHGVPNFPDPTNPSEGFSITGHLNGHATGPLAQANDACEHLLPRGSVTTGSGGVPQSQLDLALKVVQCLRVHGEPNLPDPTVVNGSLHLTLQLGVVQSAQFQAAVNACRSLIPKGVHFP